MNVGSPRDIIIIINKIVRYQVANIPCNLTVQFIIMSMGTKSTYYQLFKKILDNLFAKILKSWKLHTNSPRGLIFSYWSKTHNEYYNKLLRTMITNEWTLSSLFNFGMNKIKGKYRNNIQSIQWIHLVFFFSNFL